MQETSRSEPAVNRADRIPWGWVALTVVLLEIALILSAVAWVAIYSYLIAPGHDMPYYQTYAEFASPIVSVVIGIPYLFLAGRWVGRKAGTRAVAAALSVWLILFTIDVLLLLLAGITAYIAAMVALSHATKMLAAYFGGKAALQEVLSNRRAVVS